MNHDMGQGRVVLQGGTRTSPIMPTEALCVSFRINGADMRQGCYLEAKERINARLACGFSPVAAVPARARARAYAWPLLAGWLAGAAGSVAEGEAPYRIRAFQDLATRARGEVGQAKLGAATHPACSCAHIGRSARVECVWVLAPASC